MADPIKIDITRLASLLKDPDDNVAVSAMAELINREDELGDLLAALQDSSHPLMRRRVHQLQSALTMIRRRRSLSNLLHLEKVNFAEALIQIHLQWFDRDSESDLRSKLEHFCQRMQLFPARTLEEIGHAFAAYGIIPCPVTTLKIEQYCLGAMLDDRCGAAPLWCGLICELYPGRGLRTVCDRGRFAVADKENLLIPEDNWQISPLPQYAFEEWDARVLLRLAMMTLFSAAVNSDSFRYILTIAQALTGCENAEALNTLPYPYNPGLEELS